jgi:alkylhydroperoxidase/carboxymuconolactone decarboxylase family protein YurZ
MSLFLAAVAAVTPLTPQHSADLRCVSMLAIVADAQVREAGWEDVEPLRESGARYAGVIGEAVMKDTGRSREAVRDLILRGVAGFQKGGVIAPAEVATCIARMKVAAPPMVESSLPRCAAILSLAAEAVKKREGLSKGAKDLATLASVLAYRARVEGGSSEAEVAAAIDVERAAAAKAGGAAEPEIQDCAQLAAAD